MWARFSVAVVCVALGSAVNLKAQQPNTENGVAAAWDVRSFMTELDNGVRNLEPLLGSLTPRDWIAKGAPGAYIRQVESTQKSMLSLFEATSKLSHEPERLTAAIDAYFQMERMELLLNSLKEGVRKYQSSEAADRFNVVIGENSVHRDRLRQHVSDLAATREQEFRIVDQEAQRCRGLILRQPEPTRSERPRKSRR